MRTECRERFPRHRLQRKPLVSDSGMHQDTCVTHVPWCMSGSLIRGGGENVPGIPGACVTPTFTYLARGPWLACIHYVYAYPLGSVTSIELMLFVWTNRVMVPIENVVGISEVQGDQWLESPPWYNSYVPLHIASKTMHINTHAHIHVVLIWWVLLAVSHAVVPLLFNTTIRFMIMFHQFKQTKILKI